MSALRQVLTPPNSAKVAPGLDKGQVRRILGRPAKRHVYELKQQEVWDWRWLDGGQNATLSIVFDRDGRVLSQATGADPLDTQTGGR